MIPFIRTIFLLIILCSIASCLHIPKSKIIPIDHQVNLTVCNRPYKTKGVYKKFQKTVLDMFNVSDTSTVDSVQITFTPENELVLGYQVNAQHIQNTYKGKFRRKGYYEYYFFREAKRIPLIYADVFIERIRLAKTKQGDVMIDSKFVNTYRVFIFSERKKDKKQAFFKARQR